MAGEGTQRGFGDTANIIAGGYSLIKGLTKKKPKAYKPTTYTPNIRPAQGDMEGLQRTKNEIAGQTASATNDVTKMSGSDVQGSILARLGIQSNANKAVSAAEAQNSELYRADQNRVSEEQNRAGIINAQILNEAAQLNNQNEQGEYAATKAAANAGVQSALNYEVAREADNKNKSAAENSANQVVDAYSKAAWQDSYNEAIRMGKSPDEATAYADAASQKLNYGGMKTNLYAPKQGRLFGRKKQTLQEWVEAGE